MGRKATTQMVMIQWAYYQEVSREGMPHPRETMTEIIIQKNKRITRGRGERGRGREGILGTGSNTRVRDLNSVRCISVARSGGCRWAGSSRGMRR